jgi:hypothetical protein
MATPVKAASTALVDWHVLGKIVEVSLALGLGLVVMVALTVVASDRATRPASTLAVRVVGWVATAVCLAVIVAAVVWGIVTITKKA